MNSALNRTGVIVGANSSGSPIAQGDVLMLDTGADKSFKNPGSAAQVAYPVVVVVEPNGLAAGATGLFAAYGWIPKINLTATAAPGDRLRTSATAFRGDKSSANGAGDFGQVLSSGSQPEAYLFGLVMRA